MQVKDIGEFGLIGRLRGAPSGRWPSVAEGIGDDCAVVRPDPGRDLVMTCDAQIENVHFRTEWISARRLGSRVAAVNLSDVAAMGGAPRWALCGLSIPGDTDVAWVEELYTGLRATLEGAGAALVGGNTARLDGARQIDLFLVGDVASGRALLRSGARPGDALFVTGELGGSAAGLAALAERIAGVEPRHAEAAIARHLEPTARVREGMALAATGLVTACVDLSDGLAADARRIAEESGVGVRLDAGLIPISRSAVAIGVALGREPIELALYGGEEYELLFTADIAAEAELRAAVAAVGGVPLRRIGAIAPGPPGVSLARDGAMRELPGAGFDHFSPISRSAT
jgi:thiamine-monophosphate kinase